jgi:hypothetical protein
MVLPSHDPTCRTSEQEQWRLVQNSTGRVIRTFATEEDAWFYQHHDSLYPVSEYAICGPATSNDQA